MLTIVFVLQLRAQLDEKAGEVAQANADLAEKVDHASLCSNLCLCPSRYLVMVPGNVSAFACISLPVWQMGSYCMGNMEPQELHATVHPRIGKPAR